MSNSWFPNQAPHQHGAPQQWGNPAGFNSQQQQQGWATGGGQWQPMQQAGQPGGFGVHQPQFTGQPQQFHGPGQFSGQATQQFNAPYGGVPVPNSAQGFPQQNFPSVQQPPHQQNQQMSYIQEQQKLMKEEQRKREMEIQKRKLRSVDVSKPTAGSLSFDDLVGLKPSQGTPHGSPGPSRSQTTQLQTTNTASTTDDPLPSVEKQPQSTVVSSLSDRNGDSQQTPSVQPTEVSLEKLMESSLTNLNDPSPATKKKQIFKTAPTNRHLPASASPKTFSDSRKARAWTASGQDFSGVFAQREPQREKDESFGEFQSVGSVPQQQPSLQGSSFVPQNALGFVTQNVQGGPLNQLPPPGAPPGQQPGVLLEPVGGGQSHFQQFSSSSVTFTSTHVHPIPSTSISGTTNLITSMSSDSPTITPKGQFTNLQASRFPPLYQEVLKRSTKPGESHVSTELVFPILMSSQLTKNVLRDLWTVANRKVPGKLDQTELFVLLGLIGLAQSGVASPTPEDLKRAPAPPIPQLAAIKELSNPPQSALPMPQSAPVLPSSLAAAPTEDFGDFQHQLPPAPVSQPLTHTALQLQPQPSMVVPQPLVPSSVTATTSTTASTATMGSSVLEQPILPVSVSEYKPPPHDKYSVFSELGNVSSQPSSGLVEQPTAPVSEYKPPTGDKYSAFSELQPSQPVLEPTPPLGVTQSPVLTHRAATAAAPNRDSAFTTLSNVPTANQGNNTTGLLMTSSSGGPSSLTVTATSFSGSAPTDTFGSFIQTPFVPVVTAPSFVSAEQITGKGATEVSTTGRTSEDQGWANFAAFPLPSSSLPPPIEKPSTTTVADLSSFDSLVLPELSANSKVTPVSAASEESSTVGSGQISSLSLDDLKPTTEDKPSLKKRLTGLDILEEEFSARVAQFSSEKEHTTTTTAGGGGGDILQPLVPESAPLDDFGDFEAYSSPGEGKPLGVSKFASKGSPPSTKTKSKAKVTSDPCQVWLTCLRKCAEVLSTCADTFSGVEEPNVLKEIASSEDGKNKLRGIAEMYRVTKRVYSCLKGKDKGAESEDYVRRIQKQWNILVDTLPDNIMQELYSERTTVEPEEEDVLSGTISTCSLCLMSKKVSISSLLSLDGEREEYSLPLLFHQGQCYHATCANFWINMIQEELPILS